MPHTIVDNEPGFKQFAQMLFTAGKLPFFHQAEFQLVDIAVASLEIGKGRGLRVANVGYFIGERE